MGKSAEEVRRTVRSRILSRELPPGDASHRVYGGVAEGAAKCRCCGLSIVSSQIQYEVELADGGVLPMHRECYHTWRREPALTAAGPDPMVRVLQIAYSLELLTCRSTLLAQSGYQVTSALGNEAAKTLLEEPGRCFDVFVIGRAAPQSVRLEMAQWIRVRFPARRIVALHGDDHQVLGDLRYNANDSRPERWVPAVATAAAPHNVPEERSSA
ncbi:MAG TPA: hypothetical protein VMD49_01020 [Steroidobacteraceae bacterium]|nr:hypothetical protein [Steroidobacteraceae bacterium]